MTDLEEQLLLRRTAKDIFSSDVSLADLAPMGWLGLLTEANVGGEGWFPYEAALLALEGGWAGTASTWYMNALTAGLASQLPGLSATAEALLAGEQVGSFAHSTNVSSAGDAVSGSIARVLSERPPDVVVLTGLPSHAVIVDLREGAGAVLSDVEGLETERQIYRLELDQMTVQSTASPNAASLELMATVLLCADTVGAVRRAAQIVTDYLVQREAFEVPIASFQVIQHRLVNLDILHRASEALVLRAAAALAEHEPRAEQLVLAAHSYIEGRAVRAIDDCIQLAGGIGFTWEFPIHHALRRVSTNASLLGSGRTSRRQLASAKGWVQ
jgi:alkylation response protein AidB-like acyl-CoA dehydrogenase